MTWKQFIRQWADIGLSFNADCNTGGDSSIEEYFERKFVEEDPKIPEDLISGKIARMHIFGRTDLGDYRNPIRNVYGNPVGVTVHVKRSSEKNILTIEDFAGECPMINIITGSGKKIVVNIGKIPVDVGENIATTKVEV